MVRLDFNPCVRVLVTFALAVALFCKTTAWAQTAALIITAPASQSVVHPGEPLHITVIAAPGITPDGVTLLSPLVGGLSESWIEGGGPYEFDITVPQGIQPGSYPLVAAGSSQAKNERYFSTQSFRIAVESAVISGTLTVIPDSITLAFPGDSASFSVTTMNGGKLIYLNESSKLSVTSNDSTVAEVQGNSMVLGRTAGSTALSISYDGNNLIVPVTVLSPPKADLNNDGNIDTDDLAFLQARRGSVITTSDARDLNGDGFINTLDDDVLIPLCPRFRCATSSDGKQGRLPDTIPPTVSITNPPAGATVRRIVTVTATASDDISVAGVQFFLDGSPLGAESPGSPFSVSWDTRKSTNGAHVLSAVARDDGGNSTTSAQVKVNVTGGLPAPTPTPSFTPTPGSCLPSAASCSAAGQCCSLKCQKRKCA